MDVVSQTSFIPKKPLAPAPPPPPSRGASLLLVASAFVFAGSLLLTVGVYFWGVLSERDIASKKESLERARSAFEPASIRKLERLSKRLQISKSILSNHLAPSELFAVLEEATLENVRFSSMDFSVDQTTNLGSLTMKGQARTYGALARQSDVFGKTAGVKNPVFGDLTLDQRGNVVFTFTAEVDPVVLRYQALLNKRLAPPAGSASQNVSEEGGTP